MGFEGVGMALTRKERCRLSHYHKDHRPVTVKLKRRDCGIIDCFDKVAVF
jgi:hypothetical protein